MERMKRLSEQFRSGAGNQTDIDTRHRLFFKINLAIGSKLTADGSEFLRLLNSKNDSYSIRFK